MPNGTILCVDDDTTVLNALRALLTNLEPDHPLEFAESGEEALEVLEDLHRQGEDLAVVISDFIMPRMRGDELLIRLHQASPSTIKIMLTGQSSVEGIKQTINSANLYRFIEKPFNNDDFLLTTRSACLAFRQEQELKAQNITLKRLNSELEQMLARLTEQARRDSNTGLPNRLHFEELMAAHTAEVPFGLLLFGIDQFKRVIGGLGLGAGDELLRAVAARLRQAVPQLEFPDSTVIRFEGVEFGICLPREASADTLARISQLAHAALQTPFIVEGREVFVTLNCGAAFYPRDSWDGVTLIRNAGVAMQTSRSQNQNRFQLYDQEMNVIAMQRLAIENDLRRAIANEELVLHYQPQVSLKTGAIVGAEALLRWNRNGQMSSPGLFIPVAESSGLIVPIGLWVLQTACKQAKAWQDLGLPDLQLAINISPRQFMQDDFVASVAGVIAATGVAPQGIELEVTEGAAVLNVEHAIETLHALKRLGVNLSIDDFGTGYSSLSYLKRFPIDKLKVDQSFIRQMAASERDAAIVSVIIDLGHQLGLTVIAEGVETLDQLNHLQRLGSDEIQGYYFGKPAPVEQIEEQIRTRKSLDLH